MKTNLFYHITLMLATVVLLASCGAKSNSTNQEEQQEAESANQVTLTDAQVQQLKITTGDAAAYSFRGYVSVNGQLKTLPQGEAAVTPKMGATVSRILVREGQQVSRGQVVAVLSHPDLVDLQSRYLSAKDRQTYLLKEFRRQRMMMDERVGAGKDYDRVRSDLRTTESELTALAAQLRQLGISPSAVGRGRVTTEVSVTSPISGTVERVEVETGQYAGPEQTIMRIVNPSLIYAELMVYQRDIAKMRKGQQVTVTIASAGRSFNGVVASVGTSFADGTEAVPVRVNFTENDLRGLIAGAYVQARVATEASPATAVPEDAVVDDEGKSYVFTAARKGNRWLFTPLEVKKGRAESGMVAVTAVHPDISLRGIALSGAYYLLSEMKKAETGED
jgi:cobalt-zinc-cadmium efflux system membrane fusion protein